MEKKYVKIPVGQAKDLTGQRFGTLTVLYRTVNNKTQTSWVCQCDCGTIKPMNAQYFTKAKDPSCGCQNRIKASKRMKEYNKQQATIKIGDRYGKLVVIEYEGLRKQKSRDKNESWYVCKCDCGNIKSFRGNELVTGGVKSCGCISSWGENCISYLLTKNNINYKKEYIILELKNPKTGRCLRFDFAVFDNDNNLLYLIEYDGRQHILGPEAGWSHTHSLEEIQYRDNLKNNYCKEKNIPLIRIPYTRLKDLQIEDLIIESSQFLI